MIEVAVVFHGPVRIATGTGRDGIDSVALPDYVPGSSLKGVMRAAGRTRLSLPEDVLNRLFGAKAHPSPWSWGDLPFGDASRMTTRVRIPVSQQGAPVRAGMMVAEEMWVPATFKPEFTIRRQGAASAVVPDDELLLAACAMAVKSLGASRRRGMGWVSMTPKSDGKTVTPQTAAKAVARARRAG